ncbi:MAG: transposase [archaeon]
MGMDVGKQRCRAAVMDREGSIIDEFAFANNHQGIEHLASRLTMDDKVAIESTGAERAEGSKSPNSAECL